MTSGVCTSPDGRFFAPVPDFRYVGLEPIPASEMGAFGTALALGTSVVLATAAFSLDTAHAVLSGVAAAGLSAFTVARGARRRLPAVGVRMGIVPWGVLVHIDETPRILRWAAVRRIEIVSVPSRVVVETEWNRFVGAAIGNAGLDRLVEHLGAYAEEQALPVSLDLEGQRVVEPIEPGCDALFAAARAWLESAAAAVRLDLPAAGYRRTSARVPGGRTVDVLRAVLRDRTSRDADPRAFAAVVAAELGAQGALPELVALTQCPHPIVAAVARQAAHRLGAPRVRTGTLDEVAPFLLEGDRSQLEAWAR